MPNNMNQPNKGHDTQKRNSQGEFTDDKSRNMGDRGNMGNQKRSNSGRDSSESSRHMSEIGRKGGQR